MNEADTCRTYVLPKLKSAGWEDETITEQLVLTPGRIVPTGDRHIRKEGLHPDDRYGSPYEIYQLFGGTEKLLQAVDEMQNFLYE